MACLTRSKSGFSRPTEVRETLRPYKWFYQARMPSGPRIDTVKWRVSLQITNGGYDAQPRSTACRLPWRTNDGPVTSSRFLRTLKGSARVLSHPTRRCLTKLPSRRSSHNRGISGHCRQIGLSEGRMCHSLSGIVGWTGRRDHGARKS